MVALYSNVLHDRLRPELSDTSGVKQSGSLITDLIEAQARRTPDAIAVVFEDQVITYRELACRVNSLAAYLQACGVQPDSLVGLATEAIIAMLGILKAGGAYLPLDPSYPEERLRLIIEDAEPRLILAHQRTSGSIPNSRARLICMDGDWSSSARAEVRAPIAAGDAANLAYVIHTAGSTCRPKGAMLEHRSLLSFIEAATGIYEITAADRILQFASMNFDASAEEIYSSLSCGATLVLRNEKMFGSVHSFLDHCRDWEITILDL